MARRYLGDHFDLHTGGIDNVFPHHEDEIAQSAPLVGGPPARLWVHGEHLLMSGRKMAKSAGNFQRVTELVDRGLDPLAFRYLALTSRYGRKLELLATRPSDGRGDGPRVAAGRLAALGPAPGGWPWARPAPCGRRAAGDRPTGIATRHRRVRRRPMASRRPTAPTRRPPRCPPPGAPSTTGSWRRIDDDLDLPTALAVVREILRADLPADERRWLVLDADVVLGLDLDLAWDGRRGTAAATAEATGAVPADIAALVDDARRRACRPATMRRADALRDDLRALGWDVTDTPADRS